ncbi:hypothetical protein [Haladaptatus halobius]|uniref:hypothetical protein n=1 Tax=Haladaptatus halobius TaxID=2884875 RepID=UPI001D0A39EC|nr:hypothetical protein [Haladaptatus halobius]
MQTEDKKVSNAAVSVAAFERPMSTVRTATFTEIRGETLALQGTEDVIGEFAYYKI